MSALRYQPHIDGLRAVAVLLVIFHHLGDWAGMSGGYVGVDVFFVISGYLISGIVKAELEAGHFTFGGFYKRRVIRLAPAYFGVLLATTLAALVWMLPAELLAYVRSAGAASVFLANFHMWREVGGYFGGFADQAPLLHLWSLAVEEQFYLFWPVALLLGHRFLQRRHLPWVVGLVAVAGTLVSQWGAVHTPAAAYYLMPTRLFELAFGALLAYLPHATLAAGRPRTVLSLVGAVLVAYAAVSFDAHTVFPGFAALAPVLGTAILLRWGDTGPIGRWLGSRPATALGRLSYPAYLWHWPILTFLRLQDVRISAMVGVGVLLATFVLAWITYVALERPARRFLGQPPLRVVLLGACVPVIATLAAVLLVMQMKGLPGRYPDSLNLKSEALLAYSSKLRGRCNEGPPINPLPADECILGRAGGKVDVLLVGDSHANHFTGFLDELAKNAGLRGYDMTRSNTPYLPTVQLFLANEPAYSANFTLRNDYITKFLAQHRYEVIVLAGAYATFLNRDMARLPGVSPREAFESGMRLALAHATAASDRVLVLTQVPYPNESLFDCPLRRERFGYAETCSWPLADHLRYSSLERQAVATLAKEFPEVQWIDVGKLVCDGRACTTELDGIPLYRDEGHLNDFGSRALAKRWLARFGNPLIAPTGHAHATSQATE